MKSEIRILTQIGLQRGCIPLQDPRQREIDNKIKRESAQAAYDYVHPIWLKANGLTK